MQGVGQLSDDERRALIGALLDEKIKLTEERDQYKKLYMELLDRCKMLENGILAGRKAARRAERSPDPPWRSGFALDQHTVASEYLGDDEFGHPRFDTRRSDIGELLYELKYRKNTAVVDAIVAAAVGFLRAWNPGVYLLIPIPASRRRELQPVELLAQPIAAALDIEYGDDRVRRTRPARELKDVFDYDDRLKLLEGAHEVDVERTRGRSVLLFDDLYRSGATVNAIAELLHDHARARDVHVLTITMTRRVR